MDQQNQRQLPGQHADRINWYAAAFGAAVIGGIAYGLVLVVGMIIGATGWKAWIPVAALTVGLVLVGTAMGRMLNGIRTRTAGAAIAAASLVGGPFAVEAFVIWLVNSGS
ncbi:MAG: hypothetical protein ACSLE6_09880 [Mycobacterium sp.]